MGWAICRRTTLTVARMGRYCEPVKAGWSRKTSNKSKTCSKNQVVWGGFKPRMAFGVQGAGAGQGGELGRSVVSRQYNGLACWGERAMDAKGA